MATFMFATGVENSSPTIAGGKRVDEIRPVGRTYKEMIAAWRELLPVHSNVLTLPLAQVQ